MNIVKAWTRRGLLTVVILLSLSMAACVPARSGTSWAGLRAVGNDQNILVAYNDRVDLVDSKKGIPIERTNPDNTPMVDQDNKVQFWQIKPPDKGTASEFFSAPLVLPGDANAAIDSTPEASVEATPEATPNSKATNASPAEGQGTTILIAAFDNRAIYKVNLGDAKILNTYSIDGPTLADLVLVGKSVYVAYSDKGVAALNLDDFKPRWRFDTDQGVWSKPLVADDVVYVSALDHHLYAIDDAKGELLWKLDLEGAVTSTPVYKDGHLYIGSLARKIFDISTDGKILAEYPTQDWIWGSPVLEGDILYAADMGGNVYALDVKNQLKEIWKAHIANMGIRATPVVTDKAVIVASRDGHVYWLTKEQGAIIQNEDLGAEILSDMLIIHIKSQTGTDAPLLIVSTIAIDKLLVAFPLGGGQRSWVYARQ